MESSPSPAFSTGEPLSGLEILAELRRIQAAGETYLNALPAATFVQPQGPKWSPADHVRHLAKSTFPVARALGQPRFLLAILFGLHRGLSRSFPELRETYQGTLRAGGQAGRFAPSPQPPPADPEQWRREVLARWRKSVDAVQSGVGGWTESQMDRYRLPHPLLGKLTVREMLFFTLYHNAHHLNLVAVRVEERSRQ